MNSHATRGFYVTVGAALGVLAVRALAARRRHPSGLGDVTTAEQGDDAEVPAPHRKALTPSPIAMAPEQDAMSEEFVAVSTGTSLQREDVGTGARDVAMRYSDDAEAHPTALPNQQALQRDDAYDAVAPDDLGSEWLTRATGTSALDLSGATPELPEALLEGGMSVVSEASLNAANADEIESKVSSNLDDDDIPPISTSCVARRTSKRA